MPSLLYLIRHADAIDLADDDARPLSKKGRHQIEELGKFLRASGAFHVEEMWHSPLVRARETAELLAAETKLKPAFREHRELVPEASPAAIVRRLGAGPATLALVGHQPHLSSLASLLVTGTSDWTVFSMMKAAVLALEPAGGGRWSVRWHVSPEIIR